MSTRARFYIQSFTLQAGDTSSVRLSAVCRGKENAEWSKFTPSGTLDYWIAYVYGSYRTPLIYCPTAVMAPEGYNPLDAGQIKGMLTGMKGAAEYESLLGRQDFATRAAGALSTSHLLIIVLIIAGNIGYISSRRRRSES